MKLEKPEIRPITVWRIMSGHLFFPECLPLIQIVAHCVSRCDILIASTYLTADLSAFRSPDLQKGAAYTATLEQLIDSCCDREDPH